jgi:hypothetical protein
MCLARDGATLDSWRDTNSLVYFPMLMMTGGYFPCLHDVRHHSSDPGLLPSPHDTKQPDPLRGCPKMNCVISVRCGMMVVAKEASRHKMWTKTTRREYAREGQRYIDSVQLFIRRLA